jgi:hypothetical protein
MPVLLFVFVQLLILLVLFILFRLDPVALLHFAEAQRIGHQCLVGCLFLLFDSE